MGFGRLHGDMERRKVGGNLMAELAAGRSCGEHEPLDVLFNIDQELLVSF
jgi:hypothetical protein